MPARAATSAFNRWLFLATALLVALTLLRPAPADAAFGFLGKWGTSGTGDLQFQAPFGIATGAAGEVYVADCQLDRVQKFDASGTFLTKWGSGPGTGTSQFNCARDVAVDATGVYVVDYYNNRVQKFTTSGAYVLQFDNAAHGVFDQPVSVAADGLGHVYVVDTSATDNSSQRVQRFDTNGTWQALIGAAGSGLGEYGKPYGVATDTTGAIYVSDQTNTRVVKFTAGGAAATVWGSFGSADGQFGGLQQGLDADASDDVYIADWDNNRVQKFSSTGAFLGKWGTTGSGDLQLEGPMDVASGPSSTLYIADAGNDRIVKYGEGAIALPTVQTGAATGVTSAAATLTGTVNPQGTATSYRFEYGTTTAYGATTTTVDAGAGSAPVAASAALTGRSPNTTYHYRLVALRGGVVVATGEDRTFTTWPDPGGATGCARAGHVVGTVSVCADQLTYDAGLWTASGGVRLNGGVVVGGALTIDDALQRITSAAGTSIGVDRAGGVVPWGTGRLEIDAHAVTDPVSGRSGLAKLDVYDFNRLLQTVIGGLTMNFLGSTGEYLDPADGGGLIFSVRPSFDLGAFINMQPVGSFALGVHAGASSSMRLLGGSLGWNGITLGGGWKIGLLKLEYQSGEDVWAFTGGAEFPFIASVGGIEVSGSLRAGALDALGIKLKTKGIPLGQTGIVLDTFGGSLKGLSDGPGNPLIISALTGGGWTPTGAPDPFNWILHIKDVTLTINTAGSGTLSGGVAILDGEGRLAKGTISFTIAISPFLASGAMNIDIHAVALGLSFAATATMNSQHFTGTGNVSGQLVGIDVASAGGILSDAGAGATTRLCIPWWRPPWHKCWNVGYGLRWANVASFPPDVDFIGGDLEQYRTVSASAARSGARAAAQERRFSVEDGRPLLYVTARATSRHTAFELVGPNGARYRLGAKRRDLYTEVRADGAVSAIVVYGPRPGIWRLRGLDLRKANVAVQEVASLGRLKPGRLSPRGSAKQPLRRSRVKRVTVTWSGRGLPRGTRVDVYVSSSKRAPGTRVARDLRATGARRVVLRAFKAKTNWVSLVARSEGIAFQRVTFGAPVRVSTTGG